MPPDFEGDYMKKVISAILLLAILSLSFTSCTCCMSDDEKQKTLENVGAAEPIVKEYVDKNYSGASIKNSECVTYTSYYNVFPSTYASNYVKTRVQYNFKEFDILTDVTSGESYDNFNQDELIDSIESRVMSVIDVDTPNSIEIKFAPKAVDSEIEDEIWYYTDNKIKSIDDLLGENEYNLYVVFKYTDSSMDFESIDASPFFNDDSLSNIELAFVNYRSADRFSDDELVFSADDRLSDILSTQDSMYKMSGVKIASQIESPSYDDSTDTAENEVTFEENYYHYKSETVHGVEFVWNDEYYEVDFSEIPCEPVVTTEYYSGAELYAIDGTAIKLECEKITDKELEYDNDIYMYFDKSLYKKLVVVNKDNETDLWNLELKRYDRIYRYELLREDNHTITLGFYEMREYENRE